MCDGQQTDPIFCHLSNYQHRVILHSFYTSQPLLRYPARFYPFLPLNSSPCFLLQAYNFDTEQVINRLLEGSLLPELAALDPQTPLPGVAGPSKGTASSSAPVGIAEGLSNLSLGGLSWTGLRAEAEAGTVASGYVGRDDKRGVSGREASAGNRAHRVSLPRTMP